MAEYAYEARNEQGDLVAGALLADSIEEASEQLCRQGLFVVRLAAEVEEARSGRSHGIVRASRSRVAWSMSRLAILLEAGIPLSEAIDCVARQSTDPATRRLFDDVAKRLGDGVPLSDALARHPASFPPTLTALVRASELNGSLSEVLGRCSTHLTHDLQTVRKVRGALIYPLFMLVLSAAVTVFLLAFILPRFADLFAGRGATLPAPTRMLMAASDHLVRHGWAWAVGSTLVAVGLALGARTGWGRRRRDELLLATPVLSDVAHGLYQSRTFRAVALLLRSGVPLMEVIEVARGVASNTRYQRMWDEVKEYVGNGSPLSASLTRSPLIPEHVAQMIEAGERSGRLGQVLARLADHTEEQYNQTLKTAMQMIEPCMILFIGSLVGFVALALMLPLFQASQVAG